MGLSFNQKRFLEAYRRFYGEEYVAEGDGNSHVKGQVLAYLLMLKGINLGNYGFIWNSKMEDL